MAQRLLPQLAALLAIVATPPAAPVDVRADSAYYAAFTDSTLPPAQTSGPCRSAVANVTEASGGRCVGWSPSLRQQVWVARCTHDVV